MTDEWDCKHPELRIWRDVCMLHREISCAVCGRTIKVTDRMLWDSVKHVKSGIGEAFGRAWAEKLMPLPPKPTEEQP